MSQRDYLPPASPWGVTAINSSAPCLSKAAPQRIRSDGESPFPPRPWPLCFVSQHKRSSRVRTVSEGPGLPLCLLLRAAYSLRGGLTQAVASHQNPAANAKQRVLCGVPKAQPKWGSFSSSSARGCRASGHNWQEKKQRRVVWGNSRGSPCCKSSSPGRTTGVLTVRAD